jgi:hypothetical protein
MLPTFALNCDENASRRKWTGFQLKKKIGCHGRQSLQGFLPLRLGEFQGVERENYKMELNILKKNLKIFLIARAQLLYCGRGVSWESGPVVAG